MGGGHVFRVYAVAAGSRWRGVRLLGRRDEGPTVGEGARLVVWVAGGHAVGGGCGDREGSWSVYEGEFTTRVGAVGILASVLLEGEKTKRRM